jgi:geranylgeranyl diphosphate synthase type I
VLDDLEDDEESTLSAKLGAARTLNVSTGLLLLAHWSLLASTHSSTAACILVDAGLAACSGQHVDLKTQADAPLQLDESLAVTAQKSASLVSAICRLGALCGGADEPKQVLYARFGWHLGMVLQLKNDIAGIHPQAQKKTDITLDRPTLPLTYAMLYTTSGSEAAGTPDLWAGGAAYLTWAVAEVYCRQAFEIIPELTSDPARRAALAKLIPVLV